MAAYHRVDDSTCGLIARTSGLASGPTFSNEYRMPFSVRKRTALTLLPLLPLHLRSITKIQIDKSKKITVTGRYRA